MREYDAIAAWYARERASATGVQEVLDVVAGLSRGASVLDLGCGNGIPITRALSAAGFTVFGVDSSQEMLLRFRENCPGAAFTCAEIQSCHFGPRLFDAAVAWGVLFHLPHDDQAAALANVAKALKTGAPFLFTGGDQEGSIDGEPMSGVPFRYWSFGVDGYRDLLRQQGMELLSVRKDAGQNIYYLARKAADAPTPETSPRG